MKRNPGQAARHNDKQQGLSANSSAEARRAEAEAIAKAGMADMPKKFMDIGAEVYVDQAAVVKEANKAL